MTYFFSIWYADYHVARLSFCCACFEESDVVFVSYGQILHFNPKSHAPANTCRHWLPALILLKDMEDVLYRNCLGKDIGKSWGIFLMCELWTEHSITLCWVLLFLELLDIENVWTNLITYRAARLDHPSQITKGKPRHSCPHPCTVRKCQYEWRCMHASTQILFGIIVSGVVNDLCARCSNVKLLLRITTWIRCFPMLSMHHPVSDWIKSNLTSSHSKGVESHYISVSAWEIWGAGIGGRRSGLWFLVTWQTCEGS